MKLSRRNSLDPIGAARASLRSRHAELLILCARLGFNP